MILAVLAQLNVPKMDNLTWVGLAIAVAATAFVYIRTRGKLKRDPLARQGLNRKSKPYGLRPDEVEEQMRNVLVELSGMAREISAQMETRSQKLMILTQQADERIGELKRLLDEARQIDAESTARERSLPPTSGFAERPTPTRQPPQHNEILTSHPEIFQLAARGLTSQQIAERTGAHRGEVELILALGNTKTKAS